MEIFFRYEIIFVHKMKMNNVFPFFIWLLFFVKGYTQMNLPSALCMCFKLDTNETDQITYPTPRDVSWRLGSQLVEETDDFLFLNTRPLSYQLQIDPDLVEGVFLGIVTIQMKVVFKTNEIRLNSDNLNIRRVTMTTIGESRKSLKLDFHTKVSKILIIKLKQWLPVDSQYEIIIQYTGHIYQNNPFGLGRHETYYAGSKYTYMAETVFDPFFASRVFPGYNESFYRTPFTLTVCSKRSEVVSSLPRMTELADEETQNVHIFRSERHIPLNAVHFAVLGAGYVSVSRQNKYFVWTLDEYASQVSYAANMLELAGNVMRMWFDVENKNVERIDVVVPIRDENRTLVLMYLKKNLLCDVEMCSVKKQKLVAENMAHILWTKWFDSYVSVPIGTSFWFRKGLAAYYAYKITEEIDAGWKVSDILGSTLMQSTLYQDNRRLSASYPLSYFYFHKKKPIFDSIYKQTIYDFYSNKASLMMRMLEQIVGASNLHKALKQFWLDKYTSTGGIVKTDDFWEAVKKNAEKIELNIPYFKSLTDVMILYENQSGYPLLTVNLTEDREANLAITQEPYLYSTDNTVHPIHSEHWIVPVTMTTQSEANFQNTFPIAWSTRDKETIIPIAVKRDEWHIVNLQNTGYYRVNYHESNWKLLINQLLTDPTKIHRLNRAQLITDSFVLAADRKIDSSIPIELFTYLKKEEDPIVWATALEQYKEFQYALTKTSRDMFQKFFLTCLRPEYNRIGFEMGPDDNHATKSWRRNMLLYLCWIGDEECVQNAEKMYWKNEEDLTRIDPDLQDVVFCTMLQGEHSQSVKATLSQTAAKTNDACFQLRVQEVSYCELIPREPAAALLKIVKNTLALTGDFSMITFSRPASENDQLQRTIRGMFKNILSRAIDGVEKALTQINDITHLWGTTRVFLEEIREIVEEWCRRTFVSNAEVTKTQVEGLKNVIGLLEKKIYGVEEAKLFMRIHSVAEVGLRDRKYASLVKKLAEIRQSVRLIHGYVTDTAFGVQMKRFSCDPDTLEPFDVKVLKDFSYFRSTMQPRSGVSHQVHGDSARSDEFSLRTVVKREGPVGDGHTRNEIFPGEENVSYDESYIGSRWYLLSIDGGGNTASPSSTLFDKISHPAASSSSSSSSPSEPDVNVINLNPVNPL